ncbi:MAG: hypothetical protein MHMPM18_004917, partial [Marteilia pararefringens]
FPAIFLVAAGSWPNSADKVQDQSKRFGELHVCRKAKTCRKFTPFLRQINLRRYNNAPQFSLPSASIPLLIR